MDARATAVTVPKWAGVGLAAFLALVLVGSTIVPPLARGRYNRWGATDDEVGRALPGDELVPDATSSSTKAVTIEAPAALVHELVVQMGYQRAGWYGWDWFYNMTGSSDFVDGRYSTRVVPELQDVAVGDRIYINEMVGYDVVRNDADAFLLFGAMNEKGEACDPDDRAVCSTMSWAWVIEAVDEDTTRLILRIRNGGPGFGGFVDWLYANPLDLGGAIMGYKTLVGLRNTAEDLAGS